MTNLRSRFDYFIKDEQKATGEYARFARMLSPDDALRLRMLALDEASHRRVLLEMRKRYTRPQ